MVWYGMVWYGIVWYGMMPWTPGQYVVEYVWRAAQEHPVTWAVAGHLLLPGSTSSSSPFSTSSSGVLHLLLHLLLHPLLHLLLHLLPPNFHTPPFPRAKQRQAG